MDDKDAELDRLREENAELRAKVETLQRLAGIRSRLGDPPERANGSRAAAEADAAFRRAEYKGVKFAVDADADSGDVDVIGKALYRATHRPDGTLVWDPPADDSG